MSTSMYEDADASMEARVLVCGILKIDKNT